MRNIERWVKKRTRALRGVDVVEVPEIRVETVMLGSDYGGWTICPVGINRESVVYSGGVGGDISFDLELIRRFDLTVHAFDPTPFVTDWLSMRELPREFVFHDYGISDRDGERVFHLEEGLPDGDAHSVIAKPGTNPDSITVEMRSIPTLMAELGHTHIDILKMDIEGSEWDVIPDIINRRLEIYQILVEFHHLEFRSVGVQPTRQCLRLLKDNGYRLFSVSEKGQEYSFIRADILRRKQTGGSLTCS